MNLLFLTIIISLGIVSSYEDFRIGKIRNIWIGLALLSGLLLYFYSWFFGKISGSNLSEIFINSILALLVGFSLWRAQAWSAGDAKLFFAYAFLLPFSFYNKSFLPIFPAFVIILNSFLLVLLFLSIKAFYFLIIQDKFSSLKFSLDQFKKYFWSLGMILPPFLLFMTLLAFLYQVLLVRYSFGLLWFQVIAIIVFIFLTSILVKFYQKKYTHRLSLILFIVLVYFGWRADAVLMKNFLINLSWGVMVFIIAFPLLHRLIEYYLEETRGHDLAIHNLRKGMILKKSSLILLGLPANSAFAFVGMNDAQVLQVTTLATEKGIEKIKVGRPFYFAFWLFAGVLLTIILKGSFL